MLDSDVLPSSWLELSKVSIMLFELNKISLMLFVFEILCQSSQMQFDENRRNNDW